MKKNAPKVEGQFTKVSEDNEKALLKAVFSFHPTRELPKDCEIFVGMCLGHLTFFTMSSDMVLLGSKPIEEDAISVRKCVKELANAYALAIKERSDLKYNNSPLKRIAQLFAKLTEVYPTIAAPLINQHLIERLPHRAQPLESQYMYYRFAFDVLRLSPNNEEKILTAIVDKLCQLDVDIKQAKPCRRYNFFASLSNVQPMSAFIKEVTLKIPSEKEFKMGLLFEKLIEYVKERLINEDQDETSFIELLQKIFESKIYPLHKVNFMQYLPLTVIGMAKEVPKCEQKCLLFTQ